MNLCNAPDNGFMYALYTDRVIYETYRKEQLPSEDELMKNLLELHRYGEGISLYQNCINSFLSSILSLWL